MHERIITAIKYMIEKHGEATRRGSTTPYFIHPLNVMNILLEEQGHDKSVKDEVVIAGLLHDLNEDADISISEIEKTFGKEIARLVKNVSEPEEFKNNSDKINTWKIRKEHSINIARTSDINTKLLFCADKLDNILSISRDINSGIEVWKKFHAGKDNVKWYYTSALEALKSGESIEHTRTYKLLKIEIKRLFG